METDAQCRMLGMAENAFVAMVRERQMTRWKKSELTRVVSKPT